MTEKQLRTEKLKFEFLNQLRETGGNVLRSCEIVGASRATMLRHYEKDDQFREKWDSAVKGELIQKDVNSILINQAKPSTFDTNLKPEKTGFSDLTKLNNSDLTKPDLSESENSTKLHIQNDTNTDRRNELLTNANNSDDNLLANSESEKASKSKQFSTESSVQKETKSLSVPVRASDHRLTAFSQKLSSNYSRPVMRICSPKKTDLDEKD